MHGYRRNDHRLQVQYFNQDVHVGHALACSEIAATCNYDNNRQLSFENHSCCTEKITKSSEPAQIKADEEARLQQLEEQSGCKGKSTAWTESWWFGSMFFLFQEAFFRFQPFVFGGCKSLSTVICLYILFLPKLLAPWNEEPLKRHRAFLTAVSFCFTKKQVWKSRSRNDLYNSPTLQQHSTRTSLDENHQGISPNLDRKIKIAKRCHRFFLDFPKVVVVMIFWALNHRGAARNATMWYYLTTLHRCKTKGRFQSIQAPSRLALHVSFHFLSMFHRLHFFGFWPLDTLAVENFSPHWDATSL